jgi:hypothetical protein
MTQRLVFSVVALVLCFASYDVAKELGDQGNSNGHAGTTLRGLVVLIDFSDQPAPIPLSRVDSIINGVGYTEPSVTRSLRDYWYAQSRGNVVLTHDVVGPGTGGTHQLSGWTAPNGSDR